VDNICVYGDSYRTYLIGLVVPNPKQLLNLAEKLSKPSTMTYKELCRDKDIQLLVSKAIQEFGLKSNLHKMEIPSKIRLCCEEWLPDSGLVTAALKLRRKNIQDFYQLEINKMYGIQDSKST
jgi:long-chain acyl-CoA synthetase